jgi:hypothetical protein
MESWVGLSKCVDFFEADKNLVTLPRFELPVVQCAVESLYLLLM